METYELDGPRYLNNLKDMLYGMLQSFVLTDVTLVCDDKRQFQAQKIYLSAKSFEINEISNQGKPEENVKMDKSNTTLNFCTTILDEKSEKGKQKMQIILKIYKLILLNLRILVLMINFLNVTYVKVNLLEKIICKSTFSQNMI